MVDFGTLNWTILVAYVACNLVLGWLLGRKIKSDEHFYLGNRTTPWWAIGVSVIATYVSALTFLGAPAWSYQEGLSVIAIHVNYPLVIFAVVTSSFRSSTIRALRRSTSTSKNDSEARRARRFR